MLVFNCTKAFAAFIDDPSESVMGTPPSIKMDEDPSSQGVLPMQWVVHVVKRSGVHCIIAMHAESRYAIVMMDVKRGDFEGFVDEFCHRLMNEMHFLGLEKGSMEEEQAVLVAENFVDKHSDVRFYQRSDRSVQAHITDVANSLDYEIETMGGLPDGADESFDFGRHVNALLRKTRDSDDYFYPFEVMQAFWYTEVCAEVLDLELSDDAAERVLLPSNVIVLSDYRKMRDSR